MLPPPSVNSSEDKTDKKSISAPFPIVAVRSIAKNAISTKDSKRGITMKAAHILSIAAGKMLTEFTKEVAEIASHTEQKMITKSILNEICLRQPKYRFMAPLIRYTDMQQYFGQTNELSKRLFFSATEVPRSLSIPFVAPNPPGRSTNTKEDALDREAENAEAIFHTLTQSVYAYQMQVPSFFKPKRSGK